MITLVKVSVPILIRKLLVKILVYDSHKPAYIVAGKYVSRSYLSFDFALSFYGLIPEAVYVCTSATEHQSNYNFFVTKNGSFSYKHIPQKAFECGVNLIHERGMSFRMASPEKALCDKLFLMPPVRTMNEMRELLEVDMRIDIDALLTLNVNMIKKLSKLYPSENVRKLGIFIERERLCIAK